MKKNLEYYKELDKKFKSNKKTMVKLTSDVGHKELFKNNPDYLKLFLIAVLKLNLDPNDTKVSMKDTELPPEITDEYKKTVDVLVYINDDTFVDIEANKNRFKDTWRRNFLYLTKIYSVALKKGEKPAKLKERPAYQLNINANPLDKAYGEEIYILKGKYTGKELTKGFKIIEKNVAYYRDLYYTKHEKLTDKDMWIVVLSSENFEEMYISASEIFKGKELEDFMEEIESMNNDDVILRKWELEQLEDIKEFDIKTNAKNEGLAEGEAKGLAEGEAKGKSEEKKEIATNMIKENMSIETISKITGLTKEEIEKLK